MYKEYDKNLKIPNGAKKIITNCAVIKHLLDTGMQADKFKCSIVTSDNGTVTITIYDLKLSISVIKEDLKKLITD